jgi:phosphoserine phosphatase
VAAIQAFARDKDIDLARCVAYGDDESDLPMIAAVGGGRMVQPDKRYKDEFDMLIARGGRHQRLA